MNTVFCEKCDDAAPIAPNRPHVMKAVVKKCCFFFIVLCCSFSMVWIAAPPKEAEASDARGHIYPPDGTTAFIIYGRHKTGNKVYKDGKLVTRDGDYEMNYSIVRPAYYKTIGNIGTTIQALIPFGDLSVRTSPTGRRQSTSGLMDPTLIFQVWPIMDKENQFWLTFGEWVTLPLGDYDHNHLSLGSNRWSFKSLVAVVKGWGNFYFDFEPSIEFFTDNDEFGATKANQDMDPIFRIDTHISYDFTPQFRLSLDYFYDRGGERSYWDRTSLRRIYSDEKDNHAVQVSAFLQLAPKHQLLVQYLRELEVENGFKTSMVGFRYFYVF